MDCAMAEQTPSSAVRINTVFLLLVLGALALGLRVVHLVRHREEGILKLVQDQRRRILPLPARPGSIWARSGSSYRQLADSRQVPLCFVDPAMVHQEGTIDAAELAEKLASVLSLDPADIRQVIDDRPEARYVVLKRELTDAEAQAVRDLDIQAVAGISYEWKRFYPNGSLAANTLGFSYKGFCYDRSDLGSPDRIGTGLELVMAPFMAKHGAHGRSSPCD
jgi:cell division protein FtsI/penicillin-binding protein 2